MSKLNFIVSIELDDSGLPPPTPEIEQERRLAIFDLIEENTFALAESIKKGGTTDGPYNLILAVKGFRLVFSIRNAKTGKKVLDLLLSLSPFNRIIKEYSDICASYFDAVKRLPASKIEAIDMARRAIHDQGGDVVLERFEGKIITDKATARRLFTLICVLQYRF